MTVQEIVNTLTSSLEDDARRYLEEARRVAEQDAVLRDAQREILVLSENVSRLLHEEARLTAAVRSVAAHHADARTTLDDIEKNLDDLRRAAPDDDDNVVDRRDAVWRRAIEVETRLRGVRDSIDATVEDWNATVANSANLDDDDGTTGDVVRVLHAHLDTLAWLEGTGKSLEADVTAVGRALTERYGR